jgi:hypothetical protein
VQRWRVWEREEEEEREGVLSFNRTLRPSGSVIISDWPMGRLSAVTGAAFLAGFVGAIVWLLWVVSRRGKELGPLLLQVLEASNRDESVTGLVRVAVLERVCVRVCPLATEGRGCACE